MKCPVCKNESIKSKCDHCGFQIKAIPANASPEAFEAYQQEIEAAKIAFDTYLNPTEISKAPFFLLRRDPFQPRVEFHELLKNMKPLKAGCVEFIASKDPSKNKYDAETKKFYVSVTNDNLVYANKQFVMEVVVDSPGDNPPDHVKSKFNGVMKELMTGLVGEYYISVDGPKAKEIYEKGLEKDSDLSKYDLFIYLKEYRNNHDYVEVSDCFIHFKDEDIKLIRVK